MRALTIAFALAALAFASAQRGNKGPDVNSKRNERAPTYTKMTDAQVHAKIDYQLGKAKYRGPARLPPQLNARKPWITGANIDVYRPGRWDSSYNVVFFRTIVTGDSVGEWDGTVGYVEFKPPSTGQYLVMTHFSGYKARCDVSGPWGVSSSATETTSEEGLVATVYTATNTNKLYFTFNFKRTDGNTLSTAYWRGTEFVKL